MVAVVEAVAGEAAVAEAVVVGVGLEAAEAEERAAELAAVELAAVVEEEAPGSPLQSLHGSPRTLPASRPKRWPL